MAIKAIVIDEDYDAVRTISELLELENILVVGMGYDGKQAVQLYRKYRPDVVLCDLRMPVYDGYFALQKIRRLDPNAKVIMVTGDSHFDSQENLEELGAVAVVHKNRELGDLANLVKKTCKKGFFGQTVKVFQTQNMDI